MVLDDEQHDLAVPVAAAESEVGWISAINYLKNNLNENWLTKGRKYPVIDGRFYCPQCFHDSIRVSQTFRELIRSSPSSYSRNRDVRRHWIKRSRRNGLSSHLGNGVLRKYAI